jgi:hypothetical protein
MLPLYFVLPICKKTSENRSDAPILLAIPSKHGNDSHCRPFTAPIQNWRSLTITKLTQSAVKMNKLKNKATQKLQLPLAAAELKIELFFNCRPH